MELITGAGEEAAVSTYWINILQNKHFADTISISDALFQSLTHAQLFIPTWKAEARCISRTRGQRHRREYIIYGRFIDHLLECDWLMTVVLAGWSNWTDLRAAWWVACRWATEPATKSAARGGSSQLKAAAPTDGQTICPVMLQAYSHPCHWFYSIQVEINQYRQAKTSPAPRTIVRIFIEYEKSVRELGSDQ